MKEFIRKVSERTHLSREEASDAMRKIMDGEATEAQIAGLLMALKLKGEHADELLGFVQVMRERSIKISIDDPDAVDLCGTGGDAMGTFNISTVAAFVVAGAGATVAKHGNRSISSACGSADVLSALCVNIEIRPERVQDCINAIGIGFLFAPMFHPAMRHAGKPRSELGVKTCFNLLGPLTNPAGVRRQLVGAFSEDAARSIAEVFSRLNSERVLVVHGRDGLDEVSLGAPTTVFDVPGPPASGQYDLDPGLFGLTPASRSEVAGGTAPVNAEIAVKILDGERSPHRDFVLANASLGLMAAGKVRTVREGVELAAESIDSGRARKKLETLREFTAR